MCGIVGQIFVSGELQYNDNAMSKALSKLSKRGPDHQGIVKLGKVHFGHARLSIIDTSEESNQPFVSEDGRYILVFNGEIFNFKELKEELEKEGIHFRTTGDTEVLMALLIKHGSAALNKLNGFFAFCFHDSKEGISILGRDRYGIKPLVYHFRENCLTFASEIKAMNPFIGKQELDLMSLRYFFQFNYISAPYTILKKVFKMRPGFYLIVDSNGVKEEQYYEIPVNGTKTKDYDAAKSEVYKILHEATERRMISDVPLGSFLSGGIDSSIVSLIASKYTSKLQTFSIGFKDHPFFDETEYARIVAKRIGSKHTELMLSNEDLLEGFDKTLNYFDEPFADSSALNMFILSEKTREHVTVALSGDGADELFAGYNKHEALRKADENSLSNKIVKSFGGGISRMLPKSRESRLGNFSRKLSKFSEGLNLTQDQRYLVWASFMGVDQGDQLTNLKLENRPQLDFLSKNISGFNDYLFRDFKLVLEGDMLRKVDAMSMANSLEVRTPFLDVNLVDFVFGLPSEFKIDQNSRKKILKDAFRAELPEDIFNRGKHGFEVPLKQWFKSELKHVLDQRVFNRELVKDIGILDWNIVEEIQNKMNSVDSGDSIYNVWALLSFQTWYSNYLNEVSNA
ncbi:MAG: asparagine synthase (glutamine-hydrolyzing) [Flavobacteriales bacterium]|nr:asparagine synthase (glutamine-hydrolyzing) [Flavobacteriales bacterium]